MTQATVFEIIDGLGLPDGVVNLVNGGADVVNAILASPGIDAVSFVGSAPVARLVYERAAQAGKRVQALGGAKNHMVVMPDADMDATADAVVGSAYGSAGERCMAISAVVAVGPAGDALIDAVKPRIEALRVDAGTADGAEMGPLVTGAHRDKVVSFVDAGVSEGAELILDGRDAAAGSEGFFLGPCLFDHVKPSMSIYTEEIFGPVLSVVRVETFDEAVELVNANPYGNGTAIFTSSGAAARAFQREIQVGMVGINVPIPVPMAFYSFGGWKNSLFGDAHVHGMDGVRFYTRSKVVTSRWPAPPPGSQLGFPTN
jgi:malonate-semialdehyde dehydrogenase (acetylating)/methylmalonate-semialdehyde dehydrogenase